MIQTFGKLPQSISTYFTSMDIPPLGRGTFALFFLKEIEKKSEYLANPTDLIYEPGDLPLMSLRSILVQYFVRMILI